MHESFQSCKNILLVDDDVDDRDLFAEALSILDPSIQLTTKRDGEEMMDHLGKDIAPLDIIFLDLNMPKKNGKECLLELRANEVYKDIPIVVYTTSLNPTDIEETYKHGANFFLRKPNSFEELKETLNGMLRSSHQMLTDRNRERFVIQGSLKQLS